MYAINHMIQLYVCLSCICLSLFHLQCMVWHHWSWLLRPPCCQIFRWIWCCLYCHLLLSWLSLPHTPFCLHVLGTEWEVCIECEWVSLRVCVYERVHEWLCVIESVSLIVCMWGMYVCMCEYEHVFWLRLCVCFSVCVCAHVCAQKHMSVCRWVCTCELSVY